MPRADITAVTVSQIWDDESSTATTIAKCEDSIGCPFVTIMQDADSIRIFPESWGDIRDQIQTMIDDFPSTES